MTCPLCSHPNRPNAHYCASCRAPILLQERYRITGLLGRGGYGAVYRAEHLELQTVCALKEILPDKKAKTLELREAEDQFRVEATILSALAHPAIPKVRDFFVESRTKRQYLVMDLLEGENLKTLLEQRGTPFESERVVKWLAALCDILTYLHTQKPHPVIHRDVNPRNLLLTADGSLKLVDFGIAKVARAGARTQGAARAVSPPYSPMEQYGSGTDERSDIYALGVTAYQLLTNQLPPEAPDRATQLLVPPRELNPDIPQWLNDALLKAMAREPAARLSSAQEFKRALAPPRAQNVTVPLPIAEYATVVPASPPLPLQQKSPPLWIPIGLAGLGLGIVIVVLLFFRTAPPAAFTPSIQVVPTLKLATPLAIIVPTNIQFIATAHPTSFNTLIPTLTRPLPTRFVATPLPRTPIPAQGVQLSGWLIRTANGQIFHAGERVPIKTRFGFEFNLTNHTDTDLRLDELNLQVRAVGADFVWNMPPARAGSVGLGEQQRITTTTLDLGAGNFVTTVLYKGRALTDDRNAPFTFSFFIAR